MESHQLLWSIIKVVDWAELSRASERVWSCPISVPYWIKKSCQTGTGQFVSSFLGVKVPRAQGCQNWGLQRTNTSPGVRFQVGPVPPIVPQTILLTSLLISYMFFWKKKESSFFQGCFILMISIGNFLGFGRQSYVFPESLSLDYLTIFFLLYSHPIYFLKKESSFFQGCFILLISFA